MTVATAKSDKMVPREYSKLRDSHLSSSCIELLCKKYPKVCSQSLSNIAGLGLSFPEGQEELRSPLQLSSAFSQGFYVSPSDLLNTSQFVFQSRMNDNHSDDFCSTGTRACYSDRLDVLSDNRKTSVTSETHSALFNVKQRMSKNRAKMAALSSRISEISRSNAHLEEIGSMSSIADTVSVALADSSYIDKSATEKQLTMTPHHTKAQLNRTESLVKIEELRKTLQTKCEDLRRRRHALLDRIDSRVREKDCLDTNSITSSRALPSSSRTSPHVSDELSAQKNSGTDYETDSGIDVLMRHDTPTRNSLTPKLSKPGAKAKYSSHAPFNQTNPLKPLPASTVASNLYQRRSSEHNRVTSAESAQSAKAERGSKCVRFSAGPEVIKSETPRMRELQRLAELLASTQDSLPDTDLTDMDTSSDVSSSGSLNSSLDLTDIDPRLAQIAFADNPSQSLPKLSDGSCNSTRRNVSAADRPICSSLKPSPVKHGGSTKFDVGGFSIDKAIKQRSLPASRLSVEDELSLMKDPTSPSIGKDTSPLNSPGKLSNVDTTALDNESVDGVEAPPAADYASSPPARAVVTDEVTSVTSVSLGRGRSSSSDDLWGSNASLYDGLSPDGFSHSSSASSQSSLVGRVGSFRQAAKKKMKSLRRTLSLDRLGPSTSERSQHSPRSTVPERKAFPCGDRDSTPPIKQSLPWKNVNKLLKVSKKSASSITTTLGATKVRRGTWNESL